MDKYLAWIVTVVFFVIALCDLTELLLGRLRSLIERLRELGGSLKNKNKR